MSGSHPPADLLVTEVGELVTPVGPGPHSGRSQGVLERLGPGSVLAVHGGRITWIGPAAAWRGEARATVDAGGRSVIPGLVDPHTHAVWAGDRLADFERRASGVSYEEMLAAGGGIRHTMRATAAADVDTLEALAHPRLRALIRSGATTVEVKSGYGFTPEAELRSLEAIDRLRTSCEADILATLLIHVPPAEEAERAAYVGEVVESLIPAVAERGLARAVDVFVERESFSADEAEQILRAAQAAGLGAKLHADQFHAVGGVELGARLGALSVDHLEASGTAQIRALASSRTIATILPGVTLHLGLPAAPGRALIDAGAAVAIGTDLNPGSSPLYSTAMALALAVRINGLTPGEALVGGTANAAAALGLTDRGWLAVGARADFLILEASDWRDVTYALGESVVHRAFVAGREIGPAAIRGSASS